MNNASFNVKVKKLMVLNNWNYGQAVWYITFKEEVDKMENIVEDKPIWYEKLISNKLMFPSTPSERHQVKQKKCSKH